jgi:hypothetical protein
MGSPCPLVVTGQQIGAGWSPALSVVKALAALAAARRLGGEAVYWMADEDHDHLEVAAVVALEGERIHRHRFRFSEPQGTATGWLAWTDAHQAMAEGIWGEVPKPAEPTLRGHALALGQPLWDRGIRPFSPTDPALRQPIQEELLRWRSLNLEKDLASQADALEAQGHPLPLNPRQQSAWFSLDPRSGLRVRLAVDEPLPAGCWLSPGAAVRPLMQSLLLPVTHAVLGPAERAYWRLTEPLWERVGLVAPEILPRPSVFVVPRSFPLGAGQLDDLRQGHWQALAASPALPSLGLQPPRMNPVWGEALSRRVVGEWNRLQDRLKRLDRRFLRDQLKRQWGMDPEALRQRIFPLGRPQERVLPGLLWLRESAFLDRLRDTLETGPDLMLVLMEEEA